MRNTECGGRWRESHRTKSESEHVPAVFVNSLLASMLLTD